ncbi:MAG: PspA/IM30 family protein [Deltaproteobacteria bacterium]|jgi:phage shock protein A|nr:PspA/IM30 family protein [Deltaproteobacteria bacterium]
MPNVFSRFADIISSNINSLLDRAENPAKMLKLIIGEMEDTLVDIKSGTAQSMAALSNLKRRRDEVAKTRDLWLGRAKQAVAKDRDDLARVALVEKHSADEELMSLESQIDELDQLVAKHHDEIDQLEAKIAQARDREKVMKLRLNQAEQSLKVSGEMRRYDLTASRAKLDRLDQRLDRIEAEAELERSHRGRQSGDNGLDKEFALLDDTIEKELESLKK